MKQQQYSGEEFDRFLHLLTERWDLAISLQEGWSSLDREERSYYTEDWPINNDILMNLEDYADSHELTEDQQAQWARLKDIMAKHRKTLEEMGYRVLPLKEERGKAVA